MPCWFYMQHAANGSVIRGADDVIHIKLALEPDSDCDTLIASLILGIIFGMNAHALDPDCESNLDRKLDPNQKPWE